jgi:hypothetical protein
MNRKLKKAMNTKQDNLMFYGTPSVGTMVDGQISVARAKGEQLSMYVKFDGKLWKTKMTSDGKEYVDTSLVSDELKYKKKFTDYRFICHNFYRDIGTTEIYFPWYSSSEHTSMDTTSTAFLAPYKMTLHKLFVRPETLSDTSADLRFTLDKQDDGDTTVDQIATFTYTSTLASDTLITINRSDWDVMPSVEAGDKIGLSILASSDPSGAIDWYITSVWEVEIFV